MHINYDFALWLAVCILTWIQSYAQFASPNAACACFTVSWLTSQHSRGYHVDLTSVSSEFACKKKEKRWSLSETMPVKCADIQNWIILYFPEYIIIHCSLRLQLTLSIHSFSCPPLLPFHVTTDKSAVLLSCTPTFAPESHNNSDLVWRRLTMWWSAGFCASVGGCILLDLSSLGAVLKDSSWECSKHEVKSANTGCQQKLWHRGKWVNQAQLSASVQMTSRESSLISLFSLIKCIKLKLIQAARSIIKHYNMWVLL